MWSAPEPDDATSAADERPQELLDSCGEPPGWICEWVYDASDGNQRLAELSHWFIDRPLTVLLILLVAWIISRFLHRAVERLALKVVGGGESIGRRSLERIGIDESRLLLGSSEEEADRAARADARAASISAVLGSTVTVLVWTIALLIALAELGIQLGPLIASAGIAGVALGFGAQSLVKDCIAGLFILMEDQYGLGDVVDLGEATGVVEEIALRTTVLRSLDGTVWHVPNGQIARVGNMSQLWSVALVDVDVAYDSDIDRAEQVIETSATALCAEPDWSDDVLEEPTLLGVERLGADGVTIRLIVKCSPGSQWALQRRLRERIKVALDAAGIEIPFPQRTVWLRRDDAT